MTHPPATLARKTAWSALASVATSLGNAMASVLVARLLGPEGAGRVAYAVWLAATLAQVAGLGMAQATVRFLAAGEGEDGPRLTGWAARLTAWQALGAAFLAGGGALLGGMGEALATALGGLAGFQVAAAFLQATVTGRQAFRALARTTAISSIWQLAAISAGAATFGPVGAVAGYAVGPMVLAVLTWRGGLARSAESPSPALRARVVRFAAHGWAASMVSLVAWSRLEFVFLERSGGASQVAAFSAALALAQLASQPAVLLGGALLPHFASQVGPGDLGSAGTGYTAATRLLGLLAIPLAAGTVSQAHHLVPLLFGPAFVEAVGPARLVTVAGALGAVAAAGSSLVYAAERSRFVAVSGVVAAAAALAAFAALIPPFGTEGAAVARLLVQGAAVASGMAYVGHALGARIPFGDLGRVTAASAAAGLLAYVATRSMSGHLGGALLGTAVMGAALVPLFKVLRVVRPEDRARVSGLVHRLPPWTADLVDRTLGWLAR